VCPDDAVTNSFLGSTHPEVSEQQYNVSPTFLSMRELSAYTVDACVAQGVYDSTLYDCCRQLLAAVLESLHAADTARCAAYRTARYRVICPRSDLCRVRSYTLFTRSVMR